MLRTHTSAHQNELLGKGITNFLVTGNVYRKDEIDAHHYPVFHQMKMFTIVDGDPEYELKKMLSGLVEYLFPNCNYRFNDDYFPFTDPSYEVEVEYRGKWMEILGGGIVQPAILVNNGIIDKKAIAAGLGIDRLVMIFADIPDIRYLWSTHERFLKQFESGKIIKFVPYSKLPNQTRDISFFVPKEQLNDDQTKWLNENDFCETIRNQVGDDIESVKLMDSFHNKKLDKYSRIYRLTYSPTGPDMKDSGAFTKYVNFLENKLREVLKDQLELR